MFPKNISSNFMKIKSSLVKPEFKFHREAVFLQLAVQKELLSLVRAATCKVVDYTAVVTGDG